MTAINRDRDLEFYQLILNNILFSTENGEIYEVSSGKFLNINYKLNSYRRLSYKGKSIQAHRFIWMCYNGLIPKDLQINHKNGIKHDNKLSNLEIVTNAENTKHAYNIGLAKVSDKNKVLYSNNMQGSKNISAKLTDKEVILIRKQYISKEITVKQIQNNYNLSKRTVENILLGRSYKNLPFISNLLSNNRGSLLKEDITEIRQLYTNRKYTQKELGIMFNVSRSTIRDIVTFRTHK